MKQYRIVPRPSFRWGIEYVIQGSRGMWRPVTTNNDHSLDDPLLFLSPAEAEREIKKLIKEDARDIADVEHLKTPPRIYP